MSSNELCKACTLLEGLERGMANAAVVRVIAISVPLLPFDALFTSDGPSTEEVGR